MDKIKFKRFLSIFTSLCIVGAVPILSHKFDFADNGLQQVTEANRSELLGISDKNEYFLGAASQFSVFLHDDFSAHGSDCEGRLAAGGNANMGDPVSYSVGAKLEEGTKVAQIVVGGDTLKSFQPDGKRFVVGSEGIISDEIKHFADDGQCEIYVGKLIDFDKEFELLRERSKYLTELEPNANLGIDKYYEKEDYRKVFYAFNNLPLEKTDNIAVLEKYFVAAQQIGSQKKTEETAQKLYNLDPNNFTGLSFVAKKTFNEAEEEFLPVDDCFWAS